MNINIINDKNIIFLENSDGTFSKFPKNNVSLLSKKILDRNTPTNRGNILLSDRFDRSSEIGVYEILIISKNGFSIIDEKEKYEFFIQILDNNENYYIPKKIEYFINGEIALRGEQTSIITDYRNFNLGINILKVVCTLNNGEILEKSVKIECYVSNSGNTPPTPDNNGGGNNDDDSNDDGAGDGNPDGVDEENIPDQVPDLDEEDGDAEEDSSNGGGLPPQTGDDSSDEELPESPNTPNRNQPI